MVMTVGGLARSKSRPHSSVKNASIAFEDIALYVLICRFVTDGFFVKR